MNPHHAERILAQVAGDIEKRAHADWLAANCLADVARIWLSLGSRDRALDYWQRTVRLALESIEAYRGRDIDSLQGLEGLAYEVAGLGERDVAMNIAQAIPDPRRKKR